MNNTNINFKIDDLVEYKTLDNENTIGIIIIIGSNYAAIKVIMCTNQSKIGCIHIKYTNELTLINLS